MYPWGISFSWAALCLALCSCGFADLRPIGLDTVPPEAESLLPDYNSPVILRFDTEMEKPGAEKLLSVTSDRGRIEGDFRWEGRELHFVPVGGWDPGQRYTLGLSGTAYALDGRELRLLRYLSFFAVSRSPAPLLAAYSPPDGASVGVNPAEGVILELRFSRPMEKRSTELALSLDGSGERDYEWLEDDRVLRIKTRSPLAPWTVYRWNLGNGAKSREGVPLLKAPPARFITGEDRLIPRVVKVFPLRFAGGSWQSRGDDLANGLGFGERIGVEFNKDMEAAGLLRCLRFEPSLPGRTEQLGPRSIVFIPERELEPEKTYTLRVSADTRDAGGLKTGTEYSAFFRADTPPLEIIALKIDKAAPINLAVFDRRTAHPVPVLPAVKDLRLSLRFSQPFSPEAQAAAALRVSLEPFFPDSLPSLGLRCAYWLSDEVLRLEWEGLDPGITEPHYYRLSVPGGRNGAANGKGSYLKEDFYLYLEAVKDGN
jgi:hypothetical protein